MNAVEQKIEALTAKLEALEAKVEIKAEIVRSEFVGLYMEMADGKKRTSWLEEKARMLDKDMQSVATRLDAKIGALGAEAEAAGAGGAFGALPLLEQHHVQQRGSEY